MPVSLHAFADEVQIAWPFTDANSDHQSNAAGSMSSPLSPRQIAKVVKKELDFLFEETDVIAALEFLRGHTPPQVDFTFDELGGGKFWRATTIGVLQEERA